MEEIKSKFSIFFKNTGDPMWLIFWENTFLYHNVTLTINHITRVSLMTQINSSPSHIKMMYHLQSQTWMDVKKCPYQQMECLSLVGRSMLLQWPLAEAHFSPVSQQVVISSLAETVMKHKDTVPEVSHSAISGDISGFRICYVNPAGRREMTELYKWTNQV